WFAAESRDTQQLILAQNPDLKKVWDDEYGDRIIRLVFIGQHMEKKQIIAVLDSILDD
ncbi:MAG: GTP-binding protein, partial [Fibrobacter sp.]|nr:GTP-binding protein [Fibrobacter sp.]